MKDVLSKDHYSYNNLTLLMKSSAYSPMDYPPPFARKSLSSLL